MACEAWKAWALCGLLALASCGGGGGGSNDSSEPSPTLTVDNTQVTVSARSGDAGPERLITLTVSPMPNAPVYGGVSGSNNGLDSTTFLPGTGNTATARLSFKAPALLAPGTYTDTVTVEACFDAYCTRPLAGSPLLVRISYTVLEGSSPPIGGGVTPEPGLTQLAVASRATLAHDVVDAEFSPALNAVVMVSAWPQPMLVVRDAATGVDRRLTLNKLPKAVSVSPDGLWAAVGHDALVTYVSLADLSAAPALLNVSADVGDLVLDGHGRVHVFPATDQWVSVHSIEIATNTERLQYGPRAGTKVRLHPNGTSIYGANNGLSPDDIEHYDVSSGLGLKLRDSPYHGDYPMCGNLWLSEDGASIYTACGRTFRASLDAAQDMRYTGALALSTSATYGFRVLSLSQSAARREVVLVEQPWYECTISGAAGPCVSHLNVYDSEFLGRTAVYSIPPVTVSGTDYAQLGLYVFHRNDGARVLISRLNQMPNLAEEFLLSIVP